MQSNFQEKDNIIRNKSFDFSIRIINLYKVLYNERNEKTLSKQLLRSGTSIGANIEKALPLLVKKNSSINFNYHIKKLMNLFIGLNFYIEQSLLMKQNLIL
ncbi:four helix bundle protein [Chryseobacterium indoltheticum]|uniref:Four helix bundle protein n=1 Tax=Chryseobacterium indoltheticum TaxID=254 RepID=A0A381JSV4_9FLAO|nr:four helix bundle protein [Chryseobacterium indoltheticum]SUY53788.1 four helix bundle protein [Chryseobacterium indoltheticum]